MLNPIKVALCAALLLPCFLAGCRRPVEEAAPAEEDMQELPDHTSWDTEFYVSLEGLRRLRVKAPKAERFVREDSTLTVLTSGGDDSVRVHAWIYDEDGSESAALVADVLHYIETEDRIDALGAVVLDTREGKHLETDHLTWYEDEKRIRCRGFVTFTGPNENFRGYDLEADEDLSNYTLRRPSGRMVGKDK
jgi:LPS export ABC transporter protein LptC